MKQTRQVLRTINQSILLRCLWTGLFPYQSSWSKGISETKSKQQTPCSNCMHQPVMSQADACYWKAFACMYCMHVLHALLHDVTGQCMQLLHRLCCIDFISDIPLLQLLCFLTGTAESTQGFQSAKVNVRRLRCFSAAGRNKRRTASRGARGSKSGPGQPDQFLQELEGEHFWKIKLPFFQFFLLRRPVG